jgi:hypothetical protein
LFKILNDNHIYIHQPEFNFKGSYSAVWKRIFADTEKEHPDYGTPPLQAVVDLSDLDKRRNLQSPLRPMEVYNEMLQVLGYRLATELFLQAGAEVSCCLILLPEEV